MGRNAVDLVSAAPPCSEPGGGPWAGGRVSCRAAPRQLCQAVRRTAVRMEEANGAKRRVAPRRLKPAARSTASRTAGAGGASTRAASSLLLQAARPTASRTAGAGGATRKAAPRQSLELLEARSARYVSSASSPTIRRRAYRTSPASHATAESEVIAQTTAQFLACRASWPLRSSGDATPTETPVSCIGRESLVCP